MRLSPSTAISLAALVIALGSTGWAANGGSFLLGLVNSATQRTYLGANFDGTALQVANTAAGASATALTLSVAAGHPPMKVNSTTKVTNLNADWLDGLTSADFARSTSEDWHYIGDTGEPPFENGWHNFDNAISHADASLQHAAFRVDANGIVHVRGLVAGGTIGSGGRIFTLPAAYCPYFTQVFPAISNDAFGKVQVDFDPCRVFAEGSNAWVSLSGIDFLTSALDQSLTNHSAALLAPDGRRRVTSGR